MKKSLAIIAAAALAISLTVGAVSAQDATATQPPAPARQFRDHPRAALNVLRDVMGVITTDTGLTGADLLQQIRETDSTLAQIIEANGGDVTTVTTDIVAALTEQINQAVQNDRITQSRADELIANLNQRVTDALNRDPQMGGRVERGIRRLSQTRALMSAVTDATGLELREVLQQVRDGKTLGEVVTANGGDVQAVIDAGLATVKERLDTAVQNGRMTQEQEDQWLTQLESAYTEAMNGTLRQRPALSGVI